MELTPRAQKIKERLDSYLEGKDFTYNPDGDVVARVLNGLAKREEKSGAQYCPCRLVTGNAEVDKKIICPCVYHIEEIEAQGMCHCQLFVKET